MSKLRACFNGCSFTEGEGFPLDQRDQYIYDRLVSKHFDFQHTNIAQAGSSNYMIFMRSAMALIQGQYDIVFTQWTSLNRLWLFPGPDTKFTLNDGRSTYHYRDIYINEQHKSWLDDTLLMLNHDHHNMIDLIQYCAILNDLAKKHGIRHVHINGLVPWTNDLEKTTLIDLASELSDYSRSILDFDHRDDIEIRKFFQELQNQFATLDQSCWVNIFDSFRHNMVDRGPEGHHPGPNSHAWMANQVIAFLQTNPL